MEYPKGAIKSISELMSYKGKKIYSYSREHAWANKEFLFDGMVMDNDYTDKFIPYREGYPARMIRVPGAREILSLIDHHVTSKQTYNDWFLFGNEEDAKAYLEGDLNE